jgi:hypothetical protein
MEFTFSKQLHSLIHSADGEQVAHCLDMDLVGSGATNEAAIAELNSAVRALVFFAVKTKTFDIEGICKRAQNAIGRCSRTQSTLVRRNAYARREPGNRLRHSLQHCHFTYCLAYAVA